MDGVNILFEDPLRGGIVSQIGLITSQDRHGVRNIMAAEWAYQVSYEPSFFAVHISYSRKTLANLKECRFFGVSTVAEDQGWISSISGNHHGDEMDKMGALMELGVEFREHEETMVWTVQGSAIEMVLELVDFTPIGDHAMVLGKVIWAHRSDHEKKPLLYHLGKYFAMGEQLHKPAPERMAEIDAAIKKYTK